MKMMKIEYNPYAKGALPHSSRRNKVMPPRLVFINHSCSNTVCNCYNNQDFVVLIWKIYSNYFNQLWKEWQLYKDVLPKKDTAGCWDSGTLLKNKNKLAIFVLNRCYFLTKVNAYLRRNHSHWGRILLWNKLRCWTGVKEKHR